MTALTAPDAAVVRNRVDDAVARFLASRRPTLAAIGPEAAALLDPLSVFLSGGKRLRALFLYWGWRAGGGADRPEIVDAAAAMEFLQACALVHDDVMDRSDSRRGRPAMHREFAAVHRDAGWAGDPDQFGDAAAILLGDLCLSWADELLLGSGLPEAALRRGKPVYDAMRTELMAGQYLDMLEQVRRTTDVAAALRVATYKSAKYTIERPLQLGATLAGADAATTAGLQRYGLALGIAFQLRDDLLGVYGDAAQTGKPSGDDLREGKRTALIGYAFADLDAAAAAELAAGLSAGSSDPADILRLRALIDTTTARQRVEDLIADYRGQAATALDALDIPEPVRTELAVLLDRAVRRVA